MVVRTGFSELVFRFLWAEFENSMRVGLKRCKLVPLDLGGLLEYFDRLNGVNLIDSQTSVESLCISRRWIFLLK